jgi:hypothetical protein
MSKNYLKKLSGSSKICSTVDVSSSESKCKNNMNEAIEKAKAKASNDSSLSESRNLNRSDDINSCELNQNVFDQNSLLQNESLDDDGMSDLSSEKSEYNDLDESTKETKGKDYIKIPSHTKYL